MQVFGFYTLNYANSDTSGVSSFPSNSYTISQDYGRGTFDVRHRLFFGGTIGLPYAFRLSPFMVASSGSPFNITSPNDLNGDSVFNDRPGFISTAKCATTTISPTDANVYCTALGTFDARPDLAATPERTSSHQLRHQRSPLHPEPALDQDLRIRSKNERRYIRSGTRRPGRSGRRWWFARGRRRSARPAFRRGWRAAGNVSGFGPALQPYPRSFGPQRP